MLGTGQFANKPLTKITCLGVGRRQAINSRRLNQAGPTRRLNLFIMVHTNMCLACGGGNPSRYMFLVRGQFLNRCYCNKDVYSSLEIGSIFEQAPKEKLSRAFDKTERGHLINVCEDCCDGLLKIDETRDLFLGYLTKHQHTRYRYYSKKAENLHSNGYIVLDREDWGDAGCSFPYEELFTTISASSRNRAKIPNGNEARTNQRMWIPFAEWGGSKMRDFRNTYRKRLSEQLTKIISPDIVFAKIALKNVGELSKKNEAWVPFVVKGESVLYRALGLNNFQDPHADAHHGSFNIIEALTNHYSVKVWQKSHLLNPSWIEQRKTNPKQICSRAGTNVKIHTGHLLAL